MWGPMLSLSLLLWVIRSTLSSTQAGQVVSTANLTVEAGRPLLLGCNITSAAGDAIRQVRWYNKHGKTLLAYEPGEPVRISHREHRVELASSRHDGSYISIKKARLEDGGCFRCFFDVYPRGQQEGMTCVNVTGKVHPDGNKTAVSGQAVALSCWYSLPETVQQVLWRKTAEQGDSTTVAYHTRRGQHSVLEQFAGRAGLSRSLADTRLTLHKVRTVDEACYTCEFHTFPDGTRSATSCLSVYVLPKPEVNYVTSPSGVTEANCTTQSRPAAEITWDVSGDNRTLGPPVSSSYDQGDGTTVVTSTLFLQSGPLADIQCIVHHQGLKSPLTVPLNANMSPAMVILLSVCGVAVVLLLCLCVCLCKCFVCTND